MKRHAPAEIAEACRRDDGKIDTRALFGKLVAGGRSEAEAAAHLVNLGCPPNIAEERFIEAVRMRR